MIHIDCQAPKWHIVAYHGISWHIIELLEAFVFRWSWWKTTYFFLNKTGMQPWHDKSCLPPTHQQIQGSVKHHASQRLRRYESHADGPRLSTPAPANNPWVGRKSKICVLILCGFWSLASYQQYQTIHVMISEIIGERHCFCEGNINTSHLQLLFVRFVGVLLSVCRLKWQTPAIGKDRHRFSSTGHFEYLWMSYEF